MYDTKELYAEKIRTIATSVYKEEPELRQWLISRIEVCVKGCEGAIDLCYGLGLTAGWWHDSKTKEPVPDRNYGDLTSLFHTEISEAFEHHRKDSMDDHLPNRKGKFVELADCVIRIFDFVGSKPEYKEEFIMSFIEKLVYNTKRADHKMDARAADGGKKL